LPPRPKQSSPCMLPNKGAKLNWPNRRAFIGPRAADLFNSNVLQEGVRCVSAGDHRRRVEITGRPRRHIRRRWERAGSLCRLPWQELEEELK
jgi:hypothetical protein